jgi:non-canonical purine NTP pyrophosphatase (RdgB/HAM1 family)
MQQLSYVSGNKSKFNNAALFMTPLGVELQQETLHLDEIQAEDSTEIAKEKVKQAFDILQKPLFVNDASWHIPALGGFPGPFMKYMVQWLTEDDILNLMRGKEDRTIILSDVIAYKDQGVEMIFTREVKGRLLDIPEGETEGPFIIRLISFTDDGRSLASVQPDGFTEREIPLWQEFAEWVKTR